ncbi:hypothetical protein AALO_G00078840 [Alosa alosa]|uniref:Uncharacterized protein n=1 Tax=Alosa alosa TaxID=278164 RepID=A0AAV6H0R1_9TELE|nr:hypothetical protein AALO_G00078840 [Alosa alosa]
MVGTTFYAVYTVAVIASQLAYCLNKMDMDEWDRPTNEDRHPIAYAFEPVRAVGVLVPPTEPDYGGEIDDRERGVSERTENHRWCLCGGCVPMFTDMAHMESACC